MLTGLTCFTDSLRRLHKQITGMAERYFEPLNRRNSAAYADAYSRFYADMLIVGLQQFHEDFDQNFPVEVNFVLMKHRTEADTMFIAEKAMFTSSTDLLRTEFYRGLAKGDAPRRCHNCGKYFLLMAGYNNCYCNIFYILFCQRNCRVELNFSPTLRYSLFTAAQFLIKFFGGLTPVSLRFPPHTPEA